MISDGETAEADTGHVTWIVNTDGHVLGAGPRDIILCLSDLRTMFEHLGHRSDVTVTGVMITTLIRLVFYITDFTDIYLLMWAL